MCLPNTNLGFIFVPKCASTTLRHSIIFNEKLDENEDVYKTVLPLHLRVTSFKRLSCPKIALVRNPFERIVSCYSHVKKNNIPFQFLPSSLLIRKPKNFDDFVKKISVIPDFLADPHFQSQHSLLTEGDDSLVDTIYKLEEIDQEFSKEMRSRYNFIIGKSQNVRAPEGDWRDMYNSISISRVYNRYKKDFEVFGYENEHEHLLESLRKNTEVTL